MRLSLANCFQNLPWKENPNDSKSKWMFVQIIRTPTVAFDRSPQNMLADIQDIIILYYVRR